MSIYGSNILAKPKVKEESRTFTESEMLAITLNALFEASNDEDDNEGDDSLNEGANMDALKEYKKALAAYKDKIKIAKKCLKKTNMKEARNYTKSALKDIQDAKKAIKSLDSTSGSIAFAWIIEALYIAVTVTFPFAYMVYCLSLGHVAAITTLNLSGISFSDIEAAGVSTNTKEFIKDALTEKLPGTKISAGGISKILGALSGLITLISDLSTLFKQSKDMKDVNKGNIYQAKLLKNLDMLEAEVKKLDNKIDVSNLGKDKE